jgi:hypothetical protein
MPDIFKDTSDKKKDIASDKLQAKGIEDKTASEEEGENIVELPPGTNVHSLPGHTHNIFTGFCLYPDKVDFASSDVNERIVLLLRRHPITNLPWLVISFFMIVAPSVFTLLPFFDKLPGSFQIIITLIWYLVTTSYVLENFLEWFFNVNLITTERVVDVDFVNLLYREVTEAELEKIQEPTFDIGGAIESFFNYGDVYIQTAAEVSRIEFTSVPKPDKVVKVLRDLGIKEEVERMKRRYH